MQIPPPRLSSDRLLYLGEFHLAALAQTPSLADIASSFQPARDELAKAAANRAAAERAMILPRVALRFAEREVERRLRMLSAGAVALDGRKGGPIHALVFPNGVTAETGPRAAAQVDAALRVLNRLETSTAAVPLRQEHSAALKAASDALDAAVKARRAAAEALGKAMALELSERDDFVRAYDQSASAIRGRFPRDRAQQDLYFDTFRAASGGSTDEEISEDGDAPAAEDAG